MPPERRHHLLTDLLTCMGLGLCGAAFGQHFLGLSLSAHSVWAWLGFVVLAPAVEEAVFRTLLQEGLSRFVTGAWANVIVAGCFALAHAAQEGWAALWWVWPSLLLGELWRRHRRWWPCAAAHASFNLSLLVLTLVR